MSTFTLDDIREAMEQEFASMDIPVDGGVLRLRNPLRLTKEERAELGRIQKENAAKVEALHKAQEEHDAAVAAAQASGEPEPEFEAPEHDQFAAMAEVIKVVADDPTRANQLLASLNGDLALLATISRLYQKTVQVGEA